MKKKWSGNMKDIPCCCCLKFWVLENYRRKLFYFCSFGGWSLYTALHHVIYVWNRPHRQSHLYLEFHPTPYTKTPSLSKWQLCSCAHHLCGRLTVLMIMRLCSEVCTTTESSVTGPLLTSLLQFTAAGMLQTLNLTA